MKSGYICECAKCLKYLNWRYDEEWNTLCELIPMGKRFCLSIILHECVSEKMDVLACTNHLALVLD